MYFAVSVSRYHDALWNFEKRINTSEDLGITWSWSDIFQKNYSKHYSFSFERMNIIFCYAAVHSALATTYNLNMEHTLMKAISSYKIAAEAFEYLASHVEQSNKNMTQELLTVFSDVMIAQANECNFLRFRNGNFLLKYFFCVHKSGFSIRIAKILLDKIIHSPSCIYSIIYNYFLCMCMHSVCQTWHKNKN
ncbi:unnamed protein product [Trichobilharzia regenti]|nr:unnamed protein product [Trichobilharzia regenti]